MEEVTSTHPPIHRTLWQRLLRWSGLVILIIAFLILFYGIIAYSGWQSGESIRQVSMAETRTSDMARQVALAREDIAAGNGQLASVRLDSVLERDPTYPEAAGLRATAQAVYDLSLIPTATTTPTPSPTSTPEPTPTPTIAPTSESELAGRLDDLQQLLDEGRWAEAVEQIPVFRAAYPDYERREVDQMLYDTYVNYGLLLTRSENKQIESGLYYLALAENLGDLSDEVQGEVFWAEQYLEGIVYYEINWVAFLSYFEPMCEFAPLFHESCVLYEDGLRQYAAQLSGTLEWCPAADTYAKLLNVARPVDDTLREAAATAQGFCAQATPTPEFNVVITDTATFNGGVIPPVLTVTAP